MKYKIFSIIFLILTVLLGYFYLIKPEIENTNNFPLGLDLVGGSQIIYDADISKVEPADVDGAMQSLKETLERRLNPFGTSEVSVSIESGSIFSENRETTSRVIIEIPGVTDPEEAQRLIGKIPLLEFKLGDNFFGPFTATALTGKYLETANITRDEIGNIAVSLTFTKEGGEIFGDLTKNNIGKIIAIFLDEVPISTPRINAAILSNNAIIEGNFTLEEAQELSRNLKFGALPLQISLASSNTISASLGKDILEAGLKAAFFGIILVMIFLIAFYRFSGVVASLALLTYIILTLSLFKFFGFVFTAAGIAGFIISIGMAVDANILIFERIKDELKSDSKIKDAIKNGFKRAWLAIRDGNISSILTAIILFYMTTSLVQGFSLAFGFGVLLSMFSAIVVTRTFLLAIAPSSNQDKIETFYFGINKKK